MLLLPRERDEVQIEQVLDIAPMDGCSIPMKTVRVERFFLPRWSALHTAISICTAGLAYISQRLAVPLPGSHCARESRPRSSHQISEVFFV
jgi:hypothetical protein